MRPEDHTVGISALVAAPVPDRYATLAEVEAALNALTDADYTKLMLIAASYCRQRSLTSSAAEPSDLLNQAVLKTLECEEGKRWNKSVTLLKHLDRAMENISGHLVRERTRIVPFPDGQKPITRDFEDIQPHQDTTDAAKVSSLLMSVFGADHQAQEVFVFREEGFCPEDIQKRLALKPKEYETINRRILRRISQFALKTNT
jgi:hypothetical protein